MVEFSKSEKRELRALAGEAYKVELAKEAAKLETAFAAWRRGELTVFDLDEQIHGYYAGPRKDLYKFYEMQNQPEAAAARALALGLIAHDQVAADLAKKIEHLVGFFKGNR
jgi:hypothetical protein